MVQGVKLKKNLLEVDKEKVKQIETPQDDSEPGSIDFKTFL